MNVCLNVCLHVFVSSYLFEQSLTVAYSLIVMMFFIALKALAV